MERKFALQVGLVTNMHVFHLMDCPIHVNRDVLLFHLSKFFFFQTNRNPFLYRMVAVR